jgi:hypothetical protein
MTFGDLHALWRRVREDRMDDKLPVLPAALETLRLSARAHHKSIAQWLLVWLALPLICGVMVVLVLRYSDCPQSGTSSSLMRFHQAGRSIRAADGIRFREQICESWVPRAIRLHRV